MGLIINRVVVTTELDDDGTQLTYWEWDNNFDIPTKTVMVGMMEHVKLGMFHIEPDDVYYREID